MCQTTSLRQIGSIDADRLKWVAAAPVRGSEQAWGNGSSWTERKGGLKGGLYGRGWRRNYKTGVERNVERNTLRGYRLPYFKPIPGQVLTEEAQRLCPLGVIRNCDSAVRAASWINPYCKVSASTQVQDRSRGLAVPSTT